MQSLSAVSFTNLAELASRIDPPDDRNDLRHRSRSHTNVSNQFDGGKHSRVSFTKSLVFPMEYHGYTSDVSDEEGMFSADDVLHSSHAARLSSRSQDLDGDDTLSSPEHMPLRHVAGNQP